MSATLPEITSVEITPTEIASMPWQQQTHGERSGMFLTLSREQTYNLRWIEAVLEPLRRQGIDALLYGSPPNLYIGFSLEGDNIDKFRALKDLPHISPHEITTARVGREFATSSLSQGMLFEGEIVRTQTYADPVMAQQAAELLERQGIDSERFGTEVLGQGWQAHGQSGEKPMLSRQFTDPELLEEAKFQLKDYGVPYTVDGDRIIVEDGAAFKAAGRERIGPKVIVEIAANAEAKEALSRMARSPERPFLMRTVEPVELPGAAHSERARLSAPEGGHPRLGVGMDGAAGAAKSAEGAIDAGGKKATRLLGLPGKLLMGGLMLAEALRAKDAQAAIAALNPFAEADKALAQERRGEGAVRTLEAIVPFSGEAVRPVLHTFGVDGIDLSMSEQAVLDNEKRLANELSYEELRPHLTDRSSPVFTYLSNHLRKEYDAKLKVLADANDGILPARLPDALQTPEAYLEARMRDVLHESRDNSRWASGVPRSLTVAAPSIPEAVQAQALACAQNIVEGVQACQGNGKPTMARPESGKAAAVGV